MNETENEVLVRTYREIKDIAVGFGSDPEYQAAITVALAETEQVMCRLRDAGYGPEQAAAFWAVSTISKLKADNAGLRLLSAVSPSTFDLIVLSISFRVFSDARPS